MLLPLAEFAPISDSIQWALVSLLGVALSIVTIWALTRRTPPLDAHLARFEAAIGTLNESVTALTEAQKGFATYGVRIDLLERNCQNCRGEVTHALRAQSVTFDRAIKEVYDRVEESSQCFSTNLQSIENRLGRVDGALEQISNRMKS